MKNIIITSVCSLLAAAMFSILPNIISESEEVKTTAEDNIYATISFGDGDAIIDMDSVESIYDFADIAVIGTIEKKCDAEMSKLSSNPYTPYELKVDKVIKGEISEENIRFYTAGGTVSVKTFIENTKDTWERAEKMGLTKLTEKEQNSKYIEYKSYLEKEYNVGETYVMLLKSCPDSNYTVIDDNGTASIEECEMINSINSKEDVITVVERLNSIK